MEIWIWFDENEGILSGIAAALVIFGALSTVGRGFVLGLLGFNKPQQKITLAELSKPSPHKIQFANSDGVKIAYTEQGKTSPDLIVTPGIISNLHVLSNLPPIRDTMSGLAKFSRVINFDKRGQGLSDPVAEVASLGERVKDIGAVANAGGSDRFVLMGISEGGPMSICYAVENPDRVKGLILFGTTPRFSRSDDYPIGMSDRTLNHLSQNWTTGAARDIFFPSISREVMADDTYRALEKLLSDRRSLNQIVEYMKSLDVRDLLHKVSCPTLVIHFSGDLAVPLHMGRYLADHIPNARFLELAGVDHADLASAPSAITEIRDFMRALD